MKRIVEIVILAVVLTVAAACGSAATGTATEPDQQGGGALDFTATTVDGRAFSGQELTGKPAVLWFWAPWCTVCQAEAPSVARAAQATPSVRFVGVAAQDQVPAMQAFVARYRMGSFPHLADVDASVWRRFGVTQQPAFAFIGPDGRADVVRGTLSEQELAERLRALAGRA